MKNTQHSLLIKIGLLPYTDGIKLSQYFLLQTLQDVT